MKMPLIGGNVLLSSLCGLQNASTSSATELDELLHADLKVLGLRVAGFRPYRFRGLRACRGLGLRRLGFCGFGLRM